MKNTLTAALVGLIVLGVGAQAQARIRRPFMGPYNQNTFGVYSPGVNPNSPFYNSVNPLMRIAPGLTMQQGNYNFAQNTRAAFSGPPWAYGYNPYPSPIFNSGPVYSPMYGGGYGGFGGGYANPYLGGGYGNPYAGGGYGGGYANTYSAGMSNPYSSMGGGYGGYGGGFGGYNPYLAYGMYSPFGSGLYGTAAIMSSQGGLLTSAEQARVIREQANQAKIKTQKEKFDFELYKKEKTPSLTEELQKTNQTILKRVQTMATAGDILSGSGLNVLLADLRNHKDRRIGGGSAQLDEDMLKQLNVTTLAGTNLGVLRKGGEFNWPVGLEEIVPGEKRNEMKAQAEVLYRQALTNSLNPHGVKDLDAVIEKIGDSLRAKVTDLPTPQYLEAKRFLSNFQDGVRALQTPGLVAKVAAFRGWAAGGGKTVLELTDYMIQNGLVFAPATQGDEAAYQAAFTSLNNLDVAVNANVTASR